MARGRTGAADQRQGGHIVVRRWGTHELLHAVEDDGVCDLARILTDAQRCDRLGAGPCTRPSPRHRSLGAERVIPCESWIERQLCLLRKEIPARCTCPETPGAWSLALSHVSCPADFRSQPRPETQQSPAVQGKEPASAGGGTRQPDRQLPGSVCGTLKSNGRGESRRSTCSFRAQTNPHLKRYCPAKMGNIVFSNLPLSLHLQISSENFAVQEYSGELHPGGGVYCAGDHEFGGHRRRQKCKSNSRRWR